MRRRIHPFVVVFALTIGCGSGATATVDEAPVDDAGSVDAHEAATDSGVDATPGDAAVDGPSKSRCNVTAKAVSCEHNVTSVTASEYVRRDVYWQMPLTPPPPGGHPVVVVYQGSFASPAITWGTMTDTTPFGGYHQGVLQARLLDSGFTVIAPAAAGAAWQTNSGAPWESTSDHVFIQALLAAIQKGTFGPANMKRLYATGISSGGYMTSRMAVSYRGVFRALAIAAGSYATCAGSYCRVPDTLPADHPPTLFLHGERDATVPIATMRPYFDKLRAQKTDADTEIDPVAGHEWLKTAPKRVVDWFVAHP